MWVQQVRKSFASFLISADGPANQSMKYSFSQTSSNKVKQKTNRSVTESINTLSLKLTIYLYTDSSDHQIVQAAFRTFAWSPKYQITISHTNSFTKSYTLQITSLPNSKIAKSIGILFTQLLNNIFAKSPNNILNQSRNHQVAHSSEHYFIKTSCAYNRTINQSLNKQKYQSTNQPNIDSRKHTLSYDHLISLLPNH